MYPGNEYSLFDFCLGRAVQCLQFHSGGIECGLFITKKLNFVRGEIFVSFNQSMMIQLIHLDCATRNVNKMDSNITISVFSLYVACSSLITVFNQQ